MALSIEGGPADTWSSEIQGFFAEHDPEFWSNIGPEFRETLSSVIPKIEPIRRVPGSESSETPWGFELLAADQEGRTYRELVASVGDSEYRKSRLQIALLVVQLLAIGELDARWRERLEDDAVDDIRWTLNVGVLLANEDLRPDLLDAAFESFLPTDADVLVEAGDELTEEAADRLVDLCRRFGLKHGLDDGNATSPEVRVRLMRDEDCEFAKVDHRTTQSIIDQMGSAERELLVKELRRFQWEGKPYVLEGLGEGLPLQFLEHQLDRSDDILVQGWGVTVPEAFERELLTMTSQTGPNPAGYTIGTTD